MNIPTTQISPDNEERAQLPDNAYLLVGTEKVFPLNKSVVNIGRSLESHLVLDDPLVSRNHAQLRAVNGHFIIFDLNSTCGTYVNGERVNRAVLYPGDVIAIAKVPLIYGQ